MYNRELGPEVRSSDSKRTIYRQRDLYDLYNLPLSWELTDIYSHHRNWESTQDFRCNVSTKRRLQCDRALLAPSSAYSVLPTLSRGENDSQLTWRGRLRIYHKPIRVEVRARQGTSICKAEKSRTLESPPVL